MNFNFKKTISAISAAAICCAALPIIGDSTTKVSAANLLTAEFETTNDSFGPRGGCSVGWTSDQFYSIGCSLRVSDRTATWNGASRDASSFMKAGEKYKMSCAVYQESGEDVEMKFTLQYKDASGETGYSEIALDTAKSGEWLVLSNDAYTVPAGASELVIYVETTESLTDFYVDLVKVSGKPSVIKKGDANGDLKMNNDDVPALADFLLHKTDECEIGADMNDDGVLDVYDYILLQQELAKPPAQSTITGDWDNYVEKDDPARVNMYKAGLLRVGNTSRLREKIAKAQSGEQVNIAYIGGSITAGGSATSHDNAYAKLSYEYFAETFGTGGNVNYINAGESGTSSVVGNMRADGDILSKNPDIIFIEFAVNDQDGDRFQKSYEALVRKCLKHENNPAVILVTLCTESGGSCQNWMAKVGENYDLPVVSGKNAIETGKATGAMSWAQYGSNDNIHPGNGGHKLIADCIGYFYRQALRSENESPDYTITDKLVFGADYSSARLLTVAEMQGLSKGSWNSGTNNSKFSANGFTNSKNGRDPLSFSVQGKGIILMFQSNSNDTMGTVNVTVNGKTSKVTSKLQWTWGGLDGDIAYYQPESGQLNVSIAMDDPSKNFVLYGIAVIE